MDKLKLALLRSFIQTTRFDTRSQSRFVKFRPVIFFLSVLPVVKTKTNILLTVFICSFSCSVVEAAFIHSTKNMAKDSAGKALFLAISFIISVQYAQGKSDAYFIQLLAVVIFKISKFILAQRNQFAWETCSLYSFQLIFRCLKSH